MTSMQQAHNVIASGGWWTAAQVADHLATDGNAVRQCLNGLVAKGKAERRIRQPVSKQEQWEYHAL